MKANERSYTHTTLWIVPCLQLSSLSSCFHLLACQNMEIKGLANYFSCLSETEHGKSVASSITKMWFPHVRFLRSHLQTAWFCCIFTYLNESPGCSTFDFPYLSFLWTFPRVFPALGRREMRWQLPSGAYGNLRRCYVVEEQWYSSRWATELPGKEI